MSKTGRPRKPIALLKAQGTDRSDRHGEAMPDPAKASGEPPEWLEYGGREVWVELAPRALEMGVLTTADEELFAHVCALLYVSRRKQGEASKELDLAQKLLGRFGFTPSDRAKINVTPKKDDPLGDFLSRKKSG